MQKGLGMWIMSKLVIVMFLFGLLFVLTSFLHVYQDKVIADTARDHSALLAEVGNTALAFEAAGGSHQLQPFIVIEDQYQEYTIAVRRVKTDRVVLLFAWKSYDTFDEIIDGDGFASASALEMPPSIRGTDGEIWFFDGTDDFDSFDRLGGGDELVVQPSIKAGERDTYLLFYRNKNVFCIATSRAAGVFIKDQVALLSQCCSEGGGSDIEDADVRDRCGA